MTCAWYVHIILGLGAAGVVLWPGCARPGGGGGKDTVGADLAGTEGGLPEVSAGEGEAADVAPDEEEGEEAPGTWTGSCIVQGSPVRLFEPKKLVDFPSVAFSGSGFGVVWVHGASVFFREIGVGTGGATEARMILDGAKTISAELQLFWTGKKYLLAAQTKTAAHRNCCASALLFDGGSAVEDGPVCVINDNCSFSFPDVAAAWTGSSLLVLGVQGYEAMAVEAAVFDPETSRAAAPDMVMSRTSELGTEIYSVLGSAWAGERAVAVVKREDVGPGLFAMTLDGQGKRLSKPVAIGRHAGFGGAAIAGESIFLTRVGPGGGAELARYSLDGKLLQQYKKMPLAAPVSRVDLFWDGKVLWALWLGGKKKPLDLLIAPLSAAGELLDGPHLLSKGVARDPSSFRAAFTSSPFGPAVAWLTADRTGGVWFSRLLCE